MRLSSLAQETLTAYLPKWVWHYHMSIEYNKRNHEIIEPVHVQGHLNPIYTIFIFFILSLIVCKLQYIIIHQRTFKHFLLSFKCLWNDTTNILHISCSFPPLLIIFIGKCMKLMKGFYNHRASLMTCFFSKTSETTKSN